MTSFTEKLQLEQQTLAFDREEARHARAAEAIQERQRIEAERVQRVVDSLITIKDRAFSDPEDLFRAAYELNGLREEPYFGSPALNKAGKPTGFERYKRIGRSQTAKAMLADVGVVFYLSKSFAGVPDRQTVEETHARKQKSFVRSIATHNRKAEMESEVFGLELPRFELQALTASSS